MISELQNKTAEARKWYERAVELDPKAAIASNNLAWIYAENGENLDIALQLAQAAKSQLPETAQINDTLGWVYYKKGMAPQAVTFLEEATREEPTNATTHYRLGLAYLKQGNQRAAKLSIQEALKINPNFREADDAKKTLTTIKS
jgi:tetratricopeptide (TPR) repeat protein